MANKTKKVVKMKRKESGLYCNNNGIRYYIVYDRRRRVVFITNKNIKNRRYISQEMSDYITSYDYKDDIYLTNAGLNKVMACVVDRINSGMPIRAALDINFMFFTILHGVNFLPTIDIINKLPSGIKNHVLSRCPTTKKEAVEIKNVINCYKCDNDYSDTIVRDLLAWASGDLSK